MNTVQRISKNIISLVIGEFTNTIIGFFFFMLVARYLQAEGFGVLSFAVALASIFGIFIDIGLNMFSIREVARDKSLTRKYTRNLVSLKFLLSIATFSAVVLLSQFAGYPRVTEQVVYIITFSTVLSAFNQFLYSIFQAHEKMEFITYGRMLNAILLLGGALWGINLGLGLVEFSYMFIIAHGITAVYSFAVAVLRFETPWPSIDLTFWKSSLRQAWPFGLVLIFGTVYYWMDSVMLSFLKGDEVVGWYNAAYRIVLVLIIFSDAYFKSVYPVLSNFYLSSREAFRGVFEISVKYMTIVAVPIGIGVTLLAEPAISLIFGDGYEPAVTALQVLIWSLVCIYLNGIYAQIFNASDRQKLVAKTTGGGAILNIILNIILIPWLSYTGAAIATVATEFVILAVFVIFASRYGLNIQPRKLTGLFIRVGIASVVLGVFIFLFREWSVWLLVPVAGLLYVGVLLIMRTVTREDIKIIRHIALQKYEKTKN